MRAAFVEAVVLLRIDLLLQEFDVPSGSEPALIDHRAWVVVAPLGIGH
jgi:hypothetical protein